MSETGRQIKALFDLCMDKPTDQQIEFIKSADFPEVVKKKVLALLKHQDSDIDISGPMMDAVKNKLAIEDLKSGDLFNEFELVRPIGRGGQGDVWLAKRIDGQFEQQVAIKILKPIHQQKDEQRFIAERALLAQLSHPNIAQLITGGQYSNDRHYMVLEWVDGIDLIAFSKQKKLSIKKRIRLFMQVCEAVAYAHQNGIIHRDIKPSNVLVDSNGVVKLLDFGVAKSKDFELTETQQEQMLTLAYASPEQINGQKASTISDVYSLGLLFYELLTEQKAHQIEDSSPAQMIESVTSQMPRAPSRRLAESSQQLHTHKIDTELDYLVLMALRKEPNRRYQTVNDLSQDLRNYLDCKPLMAGGDSWWYRSKKFLLRNPIATVMSVLLLIVILFLQVSLVNFNQQLSEQRDQAVEARKNAERQAQLANQTRDFLLNILKAASPLGSNGEDISLDDVLAIGEKQIVSSLSDEPELKSELLETFGSIQHNLGHYENAYGYYQRSYQLAMENDLSEVAMLAQAQLALNAAWLDQNDQAKEHLIHGDLLLDQVDDVKQRAWYKIIKATVLTEIGEREQGLALALSVLKEVQQAHIQDIELLGRIHNELGVSYSGIDNQQSYQNHSKSLKMARQAYGDMYPKTYERLINTASSLQRIERYEEADKLLTEAEKTGELLYPKSHPSLGRFVAERAVHLHDRGAFEKALPLYEKALAMAAENAGTESEDYAIRLNNLAYLYEDMGRYSKAAELYQQSIRIRLELMGEDSMFVASARGNLARTLAKDNQNELAQQLSELVLPVYQANNRTNLYNEVTLWAVRLQQALPEGCQHIYQDMQPFMQKLAAESDKSWRRLGAEFWLGQIFYSCGNYDSAKTLLNSVLSINDHVYIAGTYGHNMIKDQATKLLLRMQ